MRRTATLLVILALVASGCFASGSIETFVTAQKNRDVADAAATDWDDGARLVAVRTVESNETEQGYANLTERPDPLVGDGRAQAWLYVYATDAAPADWYHVVVAANGTVVTTNVTASEEDAETIVEWRVDSDAAARTLADENQTYRNVTERNDTTVVWLLAMGETDDNRTDPLWLALVEHNDGADILFLAVNARNGTYMGAFATGDFQFPVFPQGPPEESGTFDGELSVADAEHTHTFAVDHAGHESLSVSLRIGATAPQAQLNMTVERPDGRTGGTTWDEPPGSSGSASVVFATPTTGQWTITLRLDAGVAQDYEVAWCAPGQDAPPVPPFPSSGC